MAQALYRKNRPKSLSEVIGQEHIVKTLQNALKNGKISHAYLFTGPRGVGKTSVARILAHEVNQLPYDEDSVHLDIIEIDAASNRRIDEIRDLRDKVHISPTSAKYKVYIIDEVHMLTKEAFNALLKTLEEPPAHVIFILATTEAHKLPETIISRTQRFSFKPIENTQAIERLRQMAKSEKIGIDDEALSLIAEHGDGSFRDSISLLDQASSTGHKVTLEDIQRMLGIAPASAVEQIIAASGGSSPQNLLELLAQLRDQGYEAAQLSKQLAQALRKQLIAGSGPLAAGQVTSLLKQLLEVAGSSQPDRLLEIILLDQVLAAAPSEPPIKVETPVAIKAPVADKPEVSEQPKPIAKALTEDKPATPQKTKTESKPTASSPAKGTFTLEQWPEVLAEVKKRHSTLYSMLRMAEPSLDGQILSLSFQFAFHKKQVSESKNQQLLTGIINTYGSEPVTVTFIAAAKIDKKPVLAETTPVETINSIFGASEVLES